MNANQSELVVILKMGTRPDGDVLDKKTVAEQMRLALEMDGIEASVRAFGFLEQSAFYVGVAEHYLSAAKAVLKTLVEAFQPDTYWILKYSVDSVDFDGLSPEEAHAASAAMSAVRTGQEEINRRTLEELERKKSEYRRIFGKEWDGGTAT